MSQRALSWNISRRAFLGLGSFAIATASPRRALPQSDLYADIAVLFVGASWCIHCKRAAPVLAALLEPVGVPVLVASHDGRPIAPFATAEDARLHPIAASIRNLPTTLIYHAGADALVAQVDGYGSLNRYARLVQSAVHQAASLSHGNASPRRVGSLQ